MVAMAAKYSTKVEDDTMLEFKFDTQLLIEGKNLSEDAINDYITQNIEGDCLLAVGDEDLIKIHFHTNTPWKVLEYCASLGDIYDVVVEKHGAPGERPARLSKGSEASCGSAIPIRIRCTPWACSTPRS